MTGKELSIVIKNKSPRISKKLLASRMHISQEGLRKLLARDSPIKSEYEPVLKELGLIDYPTESKPVPYYDIDATAGNVTIFNEDRTEYIKQYIAVPAFSDCDMFIHISGNSMYPKYCSGELVALKKIEDRDVVAFGEAYVIVTKEQRFLKYIARGTGPDKWMLKSENEAYFQDFEIPIKKVLHLYIVKGKITKNIL